MGGWGRAAQGRNMKRKRRVPGVKDNREERGGAMVS